MLPPKQVLSPRNLLIAILVAFVPFAWGWFFDNWQYWVIVMPLIFLALHLENRERIRIQKHVERYIKAQGRKRES